MKEKIGRLAKGLFEYEPPELMTSEENIHLTVATGKTCHGSFRVFNNKKEPMKGLVYSSSRLFVIEENAFMEESCIINYRFMADYLDAGTEISGDIYIISEFGEKRLPFYVTVLPAVCMTSVGEVRDLFQFVNLVRENEDEAQKLFVSEEFRRILQEQDEKLIKSYDTLLKSNSLELAIEEFLIEINKKRKITCFSDRYEIYYETGLYNFIDSIQIQKDSWGYTELHISSDCDFIVPDRTKITSDDFIHDVCSVQFVIKSEKIKNGLHYGILKLKNAYQTIEVNIICKSTKPKEKQKQRDRKTRVLTTRLLENYIQFRTNKITPEVYAKVAEKDIASLSILKEYHVLLSIYHAHVLFVAGKHSSAMSIICEMNISKEKNTVLEYAAYLYLKAILKKCPDKIVGVADEIKELYKNKDNSWLMFYIVLYMDQRYETDMSKKYEDIKAYVLSGCNNPIIYYEAAALIKQNPILIKELGEFEKKILCFMNRYDMYDENIAANIHYHAIKIKQFDLLIFQILCNYYEKYPLNEVLTAIVTMLIRGNKTDKKYFWWYRLAMKEQLKIAELPEYYLITAEKKGITDLYPAVYTYYKNLQSIEVRNKGYLYYTLTLKDHHEFLDSYKEDMMNYTKMQLENDRISKELCAIFCVSITNVEDMKNYVEYVPSIIFKHDVICFNEKMKKVIVVHRELNHEEVYLLKDGHTLVDIYSDDAQIFFADQNDNRYCKTIEYSIDKLCTPSEYAKYCYAEGIVEPRLLIYINQKTSKNHYDGIIFSEVKEKILKIENLKEDYRQSCQNELIYYYYDNFESEFLEKHLSRIDFHLLGQNDRNRFIEIMIVRDMYNPALKALAEFGYEGIHVKRIQKLCARILNNVEEKQEKIDIITELCFAVFSSEKSTKEVLSYLSAYYNGLTYEMYHIWEECRKNDVDTLDLEERILAQILFTEGYIENVFSVFFSYYRKGLNKKLIKAFMTYYSYKNLVFDRIILPEFFEIIRKEINYEENEVCLIALLKHLSEKPSLTDSEILFIDYNMNQLCNKGIEFSFFKLFAKHMRIPSHMYNKYYVEYAADPSCHVKIRYSLDSEQEFKEADMKNVCYGIFVHEFILFYGESLHYYIIETKDGEENINESMEIRLEPDSNYGDETRYTSLNQIFAAKELKDETTMIIDIEQYMKQRHNIKKLFSPV